MIKFFFKIYGCQANVADAEGLVAYLNDLGCQKVYSEKDADVVIVNSCAIREKAEQRMFSYIGDLVRYKKEKPYLRVGIMGCVASYRKQEIYSRFDHINFVFGARDNMGVFQAYLLDMINSLETAKQLYIDTPEKFITSGQDRDIDSVVRKKRLTVSKIVTSRVDKTIKKAYINITTGCNNYCTYCIVPFTRGRETSYSFTSIVEKVKRVIGDGAKEITLIGQNVNSYLDPDTDKRFTDLLESVALIDGDFWVRYISPHPKDITEDVIEVMAKYPNKLCHHIHLPLQAGSNSILKAMNRTYDIDRYMEVVGWIRKGLPDAIITTDIIVGFPNETDGDYQETREVMEQVRYDHIYSFIYSKRKYTKAYSMEDNVAIETKKRRLEALQERQKEICLERNQRHVGKVLRTLVEKRLSNGKLLARTAGNVRVVFNGSNNNIGEFVDVRIDGAKLASLAGSLI